MSKDKLIEFLPAIVISVILVFGLGAIALLNQQRMSDVRMKYREVVDVFSIAEKIEGLDIEKFESDIDSDPIAEQLEQSIQEGDRLMQGMRSTPSFFINDASFPITTSQEEFIKQLEKELQSRLEENPNQKIVVKEFFDFNCPYCRSIMPLTIELKSRLPEQVEYKKVPFPFLYPSSRTYALAYLSALEQGYGDEFIKGFLDVNK